MVSQVQNIAIVGSLVRTIVGFRGDLIVELIAAGHKVYAFATDYTAENRQDVIALGAIPVSYSLSRFGLNPYQEIRSTYELYCLYKKHQISLSFCYFIKPVIYGTLAAWLAKVPIRVAKIEGLGRAFTEPLHGMQLKDRLLKNIQIFLLKQSLPKTQLVFFLNPEDQAELLEKHKVKVAKSCLLNGIGVHLNRYALQPAPTSPVRFIFVGRLLNEKGIRYYLAAAEKLKKQHPSTEFIVLGEPDDGKHALSRAELTSFVKQGIVTYPGLVSNVVHWLTQSSVFVLPTYYREGVPRSTQEAMAVGRAIITTDMPGCRQTIVHGKNGFMVPAHDQKALEEAMLQFILNPKLIQTFGQNSRVLAEKDFDVTKINATIIQNLSEVILSHYGS